MAELKTSAPNHIDLAALLIWLEGKMVAKKIEVGVDAKEDFAKMNKGGDMKDGVWVQIDQLYPVPIKKTPEEIIGRQGKSPIEKVFENNNLVGVGGGE